MTTQNAIGAIFSKLADGWEMSAGTVLRKFKITGGDVTVTGSGSSNVTTFPTGNVTLLSNGSGEINALTAKTTPVDADMFMVEDSAASNAKKKVTLANIKTVMPRGYTLQIGSAAFSPADATTYYFGGLHAEVPTTTATRARIYTPVSGTITTVYISEVSYGGTSGSAENITINLKVNNGSGTAVATVGTSAAFRLFSNTGLSIAVTQGDYIEFEVVCPTWATNPTSVRFSGTVWIAT